MSKSSLVHSFWTHWRLLASDLPEPEPEYHFCRDVVGKGPGIRKRLERAGLQDWRFDFAWADTKVAIELEGGVWQKGRHVRPTGYTNDCRKYNAAQMFGWIVLRYTTTMLNGDPVRTFEEIREVVNGRTLWEKPQP